MKWNFLQFCIAVFSAISYSPSFANPTQTIYGSEKTTTNWFVGVGAGAQFPTSINNMAVNNGSDLPAPYNQDLYGINTDNEAVFALSAGRRWERDSFWIPAYSAGVSWQYYFNTQVGNTIMQYSDPEFLNYNYNWNFKSNLLLATAKLNLVQYGKLSPYINGGIGAAFNNASGYSETALNNVTPRVSPAFANNSSTQFAYQAGIGLDFRASPQAIFSLGYNYQNLGGLSSGAGTGAWSNQTLSSGSYSSNEVLVSVNYLFGK
jgi:opacity protein-like surface antigen